MTRRPGGADGRALAAIFLAALVPFALLVWRFDFVCDDAFITFRYARNFARGLGPAFNPGVTPPVEGYTDLGWVLWIAIFERLGVDVTIAARATTILAGVALLGYVTVFTARGLEAGALGAAAAALSFATFPHAAAWSTGGLGTMVFALAIFAAAERLLAGRLLTALVAAAVVVLSRADGVFWVASIAGAVLVTADPEPEGARPSRRRAILFGLGGLALFGAVALLRYAWHEDFVPNTAKAKVGMSATSLERGAMYLLSFWTVLPAAFAVPLVAAAALRDRLRGPAGAALLVVLATFGYGVLVGGDFMAWSRFYLPALPFVAALTGAVVARSAQGGGAPRVLAAAGLVLAVATSLGPAYRVHVLPESWRKAVHFRWSSGYTPEYTFWYGMKSRAERWALLGKALAYHAQPGDSLVTGTIGAVGYYSDLYLFDRRGLVTPEVNEVPIPANHRATPGHDRQVPPQFFLDRQPTFLGAYVLPTSAPDPAEPGGRITERLPLPVEAGFPEDRSLVLSRPAPVRRRR